jgi:hypothetical protein
MNLSSINLRFFANIAPLISGLNKAERALDQAGRKMQATGKKLTFELTAPIAALGAVAVNTFQAFEQQMAEVKAVSGATGKEFQALETDAKRLGASTIFTAKEVGGLQAEFARLGFTADEITKVTEATLYLAQATGEDLGRSAEIAGATLRAFGLDATQTTHVADVMAEAFNKSALDLSSFADSMKYVGPVAAVAGVSLEEASAMLAVLSNSGIKGSQAGTSLRRILTDLGSESGTTAEKIGKLAAKGISMENAMDDVGRTAQSALIVLQNGVGQIDPLTKSFENSEGAAKAMAEIMGNTAQGSFKNLQSAAEGLMISVGEIISVALVPFVKHLTSVIQTLNEMPAPIKVVTIVIAALVAAIGPLLFTFGLLQRNFILMLPYLAKIGAALRFVAFQGLKVLIGPIGIVLAALAALGAIALYVGYNFEAFKVIALNAIKTLANFGIKILNNLLSVFNNVAGALGMDSVKIELFDKLETEVVPKLKSISEVAKEVKRDVAKMFGGGGAAAGGGGGGLSSAAASFDELIGEEGSGDTGSGGTGVSGAVSAFKGLSKLAPKAMHAVSISVAKGVQKMIVPIESMTEKQFKLIEATRQMEKDISAAITGAATSFVVGIAEMIGASIAGGEGIKNFGQFALQSLAGLLQQVGEMAIATGLSLLAIKIGLETLNPFIAIAAGVALVALASGIKTSLAAKGNQMGGIPALAEGGIATGPTLALIGEGKGPEAVIPLDKLEGMMGGGFGNGQNVVVTGRIQGSDILISSERAERQRSRYRGF